MEKKNLDEGEASRGELFSKRGEARDENSSPFRSLILSIVFINLYTMIKPIPHTHPRVHCTVIKRKKEKLSNVLISPIILIRRF